MLCDLGKEKTKQKTLTVEYRLQSGKVEIGGLTEMYLLTIREARSLISRCCKFVFSEDLFPWFVDGQLLLVSSHGRAPMSVSQYPLLIRIPVVLD